MFSLLKAFHFCVCSTIKEKLLYVNNMWSASLAKKKLPVIFLFLTSNDLIEANISVCLRVKHHHCGFAKSGIELLSWNRKGNVHKEMCCCQKQKKKRKTEMTERYLFQGDSQL